MQYFIFEINTVAIVDQVPVFSPARLLLHFCSEQQYIHTHTLYESKSHSTRSQSLEFLVYHCIHTPVEKGIVKNKRFKGAHCLCTDRIMS